VDSFALRRFAEQGFATTPALADLAAWCTDFCEASGDARYCSVGQALRRLDDWWGEYEEGGGVPAALIDHIDRFVTQRLPEVLAFESASDAGPLARSFRQEMESLLLDVRDWPTG
jgi:hypothetical protein